MKTKTVINPQYGQFQKFAENIPTSFDVAGLPLQEGRNVIKCFTEGSFKLNVKRYRIPIFINRIVYTYLRKSKAFKAYYNAIKVEDKGFKTASPIAYIEIEKNGLLEFSYFISKQLTNVEEVRQFYYSKADSQHDFLNAFARYTGRLHNAGILHLDYSPGNILFSRENGEYDFSLVDINRMKFCDVDVKMGCENFCRLFEHDDTCIYLAKEYARFRNFDGEECVRLILNYKHRFEKKKERKKFFKRLLGKSAG